MGSERQVATTGHTGDVEELRARLAAAEQENERLRKVNQDAVERERALAVELQRRIRNMLAVIRSVLRRSLESEAGELEVARHFQGRLDAIAYYQSGLRSLSPAGIELEDIVRDQLHEVGIGEDPRVTFAGPPVIFRDRTVELMTLAVHELTINAIKFGALSGRGRLAITWRVDRDATPPRLRIDWHETDVAVRAVDARPRGFGQQFVEDALPYELDAVTRFVPGDGDFICSIGLPLGATVAPADDGA